MFNIYHVKITFLTLKKHCLVQNRVVWCIEHKNRSDGLTCRQVEELKKRSKFWTGGVYLPIWGAKPWANLVSISSGVFGLAEGQSLPFSIVFEGRPYNTHTSV